MKPVEFPGSNFTLAKDQPQYIALPVHVSDDSEVTSCWQLTWRERFQVLLQGRMFFTVLTFGRPLQPQLPTVRNPVVQPHDPKLVNALRRAFDLPPEICDEDDLVKLVDKTLLGSRVAIKVAAKKILDEVMGRSR